MGSRASARPRERLGWLHRQEQFQAWLHGSTLGCISRSCWFRYPPEVRRLVRRGWVRIGDEVVRDCARKVDATVFLRGAEA